MWRKMMRIFTDFNDAFGEIKRDLKEMGLLVRTKTMQDKNIEYDEDYQTFELMNYIYTVVNPRFEDINPTQPWADEEWIERLWGIEGAPVNPGLAYKRREEIWNEFLHDGCFAYTYSERFSCSVQVLDIIERLKEDRGSRQLYVVMWNYEDSDHLGTNRVPCSLGWHFMCREGLLHMTYFMRSCDFATHFQNDVYLSLKLQDYVSKKAGISIGRFTHFISSFHVYRKDVKDVF
jgi:thymidylate synthase